MTGFVTYQNMPHLMYKLGYPIYNNKQNGDCS